MAPYNNQELRFDYDKQRDVLYAFLDHPQPAICEETEAGVLIRRHPETNVIVGFTIYNYSRKKKRGQLSNIPYFPGVHIPY